MTPESSPDLLLRSWAGEELQVPLDISPAHLKRGFLASLAEEGFFPTPALRQAYEVLSDPTAAEAVAGFDEFWLARQEQLKVVIEAFADDYFRQEPAERRSAWQALTERAAGFPRLQARLSALEAGLDVDADQLSGDSSPAAELGKMCCQLFVLRPAERARRREVYSLQLASDPDPAPNPKWWISAAKVVRQRRKKLATVANDLCRCHPQVAALAPDLLDGLIHWRRNARIEKKNARLKARRLGRQGVIDASSQVAKVACGIAIFFGVALILTVIGVLIETELRWPTRHAGGSVEQSPNLQTDDMRRWADQIRKGAEARRRVLEREDEELRLRSQSQTSQSRSTTPWNAAGSSSEMKPVTPQPPETLAPNR